MPNDMPPFTLTLARHFRAPRAKVFLAWTDADMMKEWWGPKTHTCPHAETDARPGGKWRACMRSPDGEEFWVQGTYREVDPPNRLVFTWAWVTDGVPGHETLVEIDFVEQDGGTEIRFVHSGFETAESRDAHNEGWTSTFEAMDELFAA